VGGYFPISSVIEALGRGIRATAVVGAVISFGDCKTNQAPPRLMENIYAQFKSSSTGVALQRKKEGRQ
jgi:hypothetical protein